MMMLCKRRPYALAGSLLVVSLLSGCAALSETGGEQKEPAGFDSAKHFEAVPLQRADKQSSQTPRDGAIKEGA